MDTVVLITTRNIPLMFLEQAIESALPQCDQVILYDDASDASVAVQATGKLTVIHGRDRIGAQRARNLLLDLALTKGATWIQFLDGDDYLFPGKIGAQVHLGYEVSYTNFVLQRWQDGFPVSDALGNPGKHNLIVSLLLHEYNAPTSSLLFHAGVFDRVRWDESYEFMQDRKLVLDFLKDGFNPICVDFIGCVYRQGWSKAQLTNHPRRHEFKALFMAELKTWLDKLARSSRD